MLHTTYIHYINRIEEILMDYDLYTDDVADYIDDCVDRQVIPNIETLRGLILGTLKT